MKKARRAVGGDPGEGAAADSDYAEYRAQRRRAGAQASSARPAPVFVPAAAAPPAVRKVFYTPPAALAQLREADVEAFRAALSLRVAWPAAPAGAAPPAPVVAFEDCGLPAPLLAALQRQGFARPTPVQAQALPVLLSGLDVVGVAETGGGKTVAFLLPLLVHCAGNAPEGNHKSDGPVGLVLAPTRELALQIHQVAAALGKAVGLRVASVFGGVEKTEQFRQLKAGAAVAVATPGRLLDLAKLKACTLSRVSFLVLDEADRMLDMGFEPQVRQVVAQVRPAPDRQAALFSATFQPKVERLAQALLTAPVRITVGAGGVGQHRSIREEAVVVRDDAAKHAWLLAQLPELIDQGGVVVFAGRRERAAEVARFLGDRRFRAKVSEGGVSSSAGLLC